VTGVQTCALPISLGLFKLGKYKEATAAYDNLFLVEQNRKEAYCNQGYAYLILNETDAAIVAYDRCTAMDPLNFENWDNQGLVLMQGKKYDAALKAFDQATYITTKNATVWNNKGLVLVALGKPMDAIECYKKALGIDPNYAEAQVNEAAAMGKQQSFNISGTITPTVTISRIGTFYTTSTPIKQVTTVVSQVPQSEDTIPVEITTTQIPKKTTYSPVSPVTVLGALAVVAGIVAVMKRK
jgi:tetratricopeptide (TPR) repeat protein